jgi:hypothetical protein
MLSSISPWQLHDSEDSCEDQELNLDFPKDDPELVFHAQADPSVASAEQYQVPVQIYSK